MKTILSALPFLTGVEILVIAGVVVLIVVGVSAIAFKARNLIGASSLTLSVPKDGTVNLNVFLIRKGWFTSTKKPTSGTITYTYSALNISISPANTVTTTRPTRSANLQITGLQLRASGKITFKGKSRNGDRVHEKLEVNYTVV